jgi:hypothetical protein
MGSKAGNYALYQGFSGGRFCYQLSMQDRRDAYRHDALAAREPKSNRCVEKGGGLRFQCLQSDYALAQSIGATAIAFAIDGVRTRA